MKDTLAVGPRLLGALVGMVLLLALPSAAGKAYVCASPKDWEGKSVGNGQCVAFVQACTCAPETADWRRGAKVRGTLDLAKGTASATFDKDGKYANKATGNHAAIYDGQDSKGIWIWDQWKNTKTTQTVHRRHIPFRGGTGSPSNDGDAFSVIETK
jgi:hypothetical protein